VIEDVGEASEWLCRAFGFKERLRIGDHRAQLVFVTFPVHVLVEDANRHRERTKRSGARILQPPTDYPSGSAALST
jgi:uncharacterized glyoxalase superfamily protein PhnB